VLPAFVLAGVGRHLHVYAVVRDALAFVTVEANAEPICHLCTTYSMQDLTNERLEEVPIASALPELEDGLSARYARCSWSGNCPSRLSP